MAENIYTADQLSQYISQNYFTIVVIIQKECSACKNLLALLNTNYYFDQYPYSKFIIADYDIPELKQALGAIGGTPTTRVFQSGAQICNDLVSGDQLQFESLLATYTAGHY